MNQDSTLAVTNTCPKDGVHLYPTEDRVSNVPRQGRKTPPDLLKP